MYRRLASSTSRMPFETAIPMTIKIPISAVIEKPWPAAIRASTMPTSETGIVKSMTKGRRIDLNCDAMIMKTTITASPRARPRPEKVVSHQLDLPDEAELEVGRAGIGVQGALEIGGHASDVAPLRLHVDVGGADELISFDGDRSHRAAHGRRRRRAAPTLPLSPMRTGSSASAPTSGTAAPS